MSTEPIALPAAPPRLIATDLDGTLLRSDHTVSPRTRAALRAAEEAGVRTVFVTGRPPRFMSGVADAVGHDGTAICSNGALVYDLHASRVLRAHPLAAEAAGEVVRALRGAVPGVRFGVEYVGGFQHEPAYDLWSETVPGVFGSGPAETLVADGTLGGIVKIVAQHPELDPDEFLAIGRAAAGEWADLTRSSPLLEISAPGVSKASTLAALCAELGVAASEVVAFGDMPNDLPMLAWAGTAYGMSNAHPDVLASTRLRAPHHDADGVARVIESLLP